MWKRMTDKLALAKSAPTKSAPKVKYSSQSSSQEKHLCQIDHLEITVPSKRTCLTNDKDPHPKGFGLLKSLVALNLF